MNESVEGTSAFNTVCLILLTVERLFYYVSMMIKSCFNSNGGSKVICQSCCGLCSTKIVSNRPNTMVDEVSEVEDDVDDIVTRIPDQSEGEEQKESD